jgi:DNA-binding XRE family transcriptional regulator
MAGERIHRPSNLSDAERARQQAVRDRFQKERPSLKQLVESGDAPAPIPMCVYIELRLALAELKRVREAAGLSLADVAARSGIDKAALSRLENGVHDNPTVETLMRYASALGKRLAWSLQDLTPAG